MKTKDSVRKSMAGADVAFERLRCAEGAVRSSCAARRDLSLRDIADPDGEVCAIREWRGWDLKADRREKFRGEQSENVYENKGQ
jgi:hypothetical protein